MTVTVQSPVGGAPINSPAFTGTPTAPTAAASTNSTQLATTAFATPRVATTTDNGVPRFDGTTGSLQTATNVVIDDSGNVGIGTTGPQSSLQVSGTLVDAPSAEGVHLGMSGHYAAQQFYGTSGALVDFSTTSGSDYRWRVIGDTTFRIYGPTNIALTIAADQTISTFTNFAVGGTLSKAAGTFLIDHPLDLYNKDLAHGFVEAPRYELMYRGKVKLVAGKAEVDIDSASNMTTGTFAALTTNVEVTSLHNKTSFARLMASEIVAGKFTITCEDASSTDEVVWVVIAERNDAFVKSSLDKNCDENGRFIPERDKPDAPTPVEPKPIEPVLKGGAEAPVKAAPTEVINDALVGTKGYPRYYAALGLDPPMKAIDPVNVTEPAVSKL